MALDPANSYNNFDSSNLFIASSDISIPAPEVSEVDNLQIEQLSPEATIAVFIVGIIPFLWATYEFWRRIAVGASFGTGSDSVVIPSPFEEEDDDSDLIVIGEDGNPMS